MISNYESEFMEYLEPRSNKIVIPTQDKLHHRSSKRTQDGAILQYEQL